VTFWIMAKTHLQDAAVKIEWKICFRIYWIMSKHLFPWLFLKDIENIKF